MSTIPVLLRAAASQWPDQPALVQSRWGREESVSFRELELASEAFASQLMKRGIREGDLVLVLVPMSIELYVTLLGLFRIGAAAMFPDPGGGLHKLGSCVAVAAPVAVVGIWQALCLRPFFPVLRAIKKVFTAPSSRLRSREGELPEISAVRSELPALVTFTSGSTGRPKAAVRTHQFLMSQYEVLKDAITLQPQERDLTTLPIFVLANLAAGVTSIFPDSDLSKPGQINPFKVGPQIRRHRITRSGGSPAVYRRLLAKPEMLAGFEKIYTGGAPVFPRLLFALQAAAPRATVEAVYGSTEAEPIAHVSAREIGEIERERMRTGGGLLAGHIISQIKLRIILDQWGAEAKNLDPLASMAAGEIIVTGAHVLKGYLGGVGDSETKIKIDDTIWHRTGDAGYLDEQGRLWLLGRCAAKVEDNLGVLYPFAVETAASECDGVRLSAFLRIGDQRMLAVEVSSSFKKSELEESLEWAKLNEIRPVRSIPVDRRHNAKVDYTRLTKKFL